jgi:hypothetical protein
MFDLPNRVFADLDPPQPTMPSTDGVLVNERRMK